MTLVRLKVPQFSGSGQRCQLEKDIHQTFHTVISTRLSIGVNTILSRVVTALESAVVTVNRIKEVVERCT